MNSKLANHLACLIFTLPLIGTAIAADEPFPTQDSDIAPLAAPTPGDGKIAVMQTACYTNVKDCSGRAVWRNTYGRTIGCSVFWNNGGSGRSNFVIKPNETATYTVRYNDTTACVWVEQAPVPESAKRSYIYVKKE